MVVNKQKNVFVTFGAGRSGWIGAAKRITLEAEKTGLFEFCFNLDEEWLQTWDPAIYEIGLNLRKNHPPRGFGYWTWKPSVLMWAHLNFPNHQILYVDAGSEFFSTGLQFLRKDLTESLYTGGLAFHLPEHPDICWTKKDLLERLQVSNLHSDTDQIQSGFICLPASKQRNSLITDWRNIALEQDGFYFTDESRISPEKSFREHRHDQSALSCLWKIHGISHIADLSLPVHGNSYGLLAKRNNSRLKHNSRFRKIAQYMYLLLDVALLRRS
jgi:hypothetical protein